MPEQLVNDSGTVERLDLAGCKIPQEGEKEVGIR